MKKATLFICTASLIFLLSEISGASPHDINQFIDPSTCGDCHTDIFEQWSGSMHNLSHKDAAYNKVADFLIKGLKDKDEIAEAESCVKCHTPIGFVSGYPLKLSDNREKTPVIATEGIQCDYCHTAISAVRMYNNDLKLSPGEGEDDPGIKYGPFDDAEPDFHDAEYSKLHTESRICGTCHNVKHVTFGTDIETTYTEWEKGPYNSKDPTKKITCQGCHMYQRPGIPATGSTKRPENPGTAADDSMERDHIYTHYFVGANRFIPDSEGDKTRAEMAVERLKNAATLTVETDQPGRNNLSITIKNTGAGHSIPTGVTDTRQVWLKITIKDPNGKTVFTSGELDKNGYLPENTFAYKTVFGDGKGNPVTNIAKAREILTDHRIAPLASVTETVKLPKGLKAGSSIHVQLLYRSVSHKLLDMIPGSADLKPPVVIMTEVQKKI